MNIKTYHLEKLGLFGFFWEILLEVDFFEEAAIGSNRAPKIATGFRLVAKPKAAV